MKKNIARAHSLLLLPLIASFSLLGMEQAITNNLDESVIMPPIPTTRGLGFIRTLKDCVWNEEDNIHAELLNKQLDLTNSSYHRKLDTAVEIYSSTRKNSDRLASVLTLCRQEPYKGLIKINDTSACMAHIFLVQQNKTKQTMLKNTIEENDKKFISEYNGLLEDLQETINEKIKAMDKLLDIHVKGRDSLIQEKGNEIRVVKKALVNLHHLNKTFTLPEDKKTDGYCSDDEKNADNVDNSYNDKYLQSKTNIAYSIEQTRTNTQKVLTQLREINSNVTAIEPINYKSA